jgi:hypothetical protein
VGYGDLTCVVSSPQAPSVDARIGSRRGNERGGIVLEELISEGGCLAQVTGSMAGVGKHVPAAGQPVHRLGRSQKSSLLDRQHLSGAWPTRPCAIVGLSVVIQQPFARVNLNTRHHRQGFRASCVPPSLDRLLLANDWRVESHERGPPAGVPRSDGPVADEPDLHAQDRETAAGGPDFAAACDESAMGSHHGSAGSAARTSAVAHRVAAASSARRIRAADASSPLSPSPSSVVLNSTDPKWRPSAWASLLIAATVAEHCDLAVASPNSPWIGSDGSQRAPSSASAFPDSAAM